jgi:hypothetical protein
MRSFLDSMVVDEDKAILERLYRCLAFCGVLSCVCVRVCVYVVRDLPAAQSRPVLSSHQAHERLVVRASTAAMHMHTGYAFITSIWESAE